KCPHDPFSVMPRKCTLRSLASQDGEILRNSRACRNLFDRSVSASLDSALQKTLSFQRHRLAENGLHPRESHYKWERQNRLSALEKADRKSPFHLSKTHVFYQTPP